MKSIPYPDLVKQLRRQLMFLRNSVAAYDAGDVEEAIRIGVVIRVLCHEGRGTSLLWLMQQKTTLQLVTTVRTVATEVLETYVFAELLAGMSFGCTLTYDPVTDISATVACTDWWEQPVFVQNRKIFTRSDVVRSAANKDGGAHVAAPDEKLRALQEGFWNRVETDSTGTQTEVPLGDSHFRMLRRFADELLSSQALLELAG